MGIAAPDLYCPGGFGSLGGLQGLCQLLGECGQGPAFLSFNFDTSIAAVTPATGADSALALLR